MALSRKKYCLRCLFKSYIDRGCCEKNKGHSIPPSSFRNNEILAKGAVFNIPDFYPAEKDKVS